MDETKDKAQPTAVSLYTVQKEWLEAEAKRMTKKREASRPATRSEVVQMLINQAMKKGGKVNVSSNS